MNETENFVIISIRTALEQTVSAPVVGIDIGEKLLTVQFDYSDSQAPLAKALREIAERNKPEELPTTDDD